MKFRIRGKTMLFQQDRVVTARFYPMTGGRVADNPATDNYDFRLPGAVGVLVHITRGRIDAYVSMPRP